MGLYWLPCCTRLVLCSSVPVMLQVRAPYCSFNALFIRICALYIVHLIFRNGFSYISEYWILHKNYYYFALSICTKYIVQCSFTRCCTLCILILWNGFSYISEYGLFKKICITITITFTLFHYMNQTQIAQLWLQHYLTFYMRFAM